MDANFRKRETSLDQLQIARLRVKLYYFSCVKHFRCAAFRPKQFSGSNIFVSNLVTIADMLQEIQHSEFIGYSSLIISIQIQCDCLADIIQRVCAALLNNEENLKYKTKFVIQHVDFVHYVRVPEAVNDYIFFVNSKIKNAFLLQCILDNTFDLVFSDHAEYDSNQPLQSIKPRGLIAFITSTTYVELYLYNINPALSIIFNNKYFSNPTLSERKGSEIDVQRICKHLEINNMPYMLMQDLPRDSLLEVIHHLQSADLSAFECISVIMMSHGDSDDVLYTQDGSMVNIKTNIIQPIQSNASLRDAFKLFLFVSCRGNNYPDYLDDEDLQMIEDNTTDNSYLQGNTLVLYSVKETLKSPRYVNAGTPFIGQYCHQVLGKSEHNDSITKLAVDMNQELRKEPFFCNMENIIDCVPGAKSAGKINDDSCDSDAKVIKKNVDFNILREHLAALNSLQMLYNDSDGIYQPLTEIQFDRK